MKSIQSSIRVAAAATLLLAGCGDGRPDLPQVYEVTGAVRYQGEPVNKAIVTFIPEDPSGKSGRAITKDDGSFTARTFFSASADEEGLIPGRYKVTIFKDESDPDAPSAVTNASGTTNEAGETVFTGEVGKIQQNAQSMIAQSALPATYNDPQSTPLQIEVTTEEDQTHLFDIP